jgi:polysaccharide pyruvyl transferase WcaK-like protein
LKNKRINIGLIWADPYKANLGVSALAYSSLFLFEKAARQKGLNLRYFIIGGDGKNRIDQINIGGLVIHINNLPWKYNGNLKGIVALMSFRLYQVLNLLKLDVIFDVGGGDSFSDIYGIGRFRMINGSKKVFRFLGKRQVFLPQTLGPFKSDEAKTEAAISIEKAFVALTRDRQSYNYIKSVLPDKEVVELIDVAFFMPFIRHEISSNKKVKIGINVSGLLWNGGYTKDNQFQLKDDFREVMNRVLLYFLSIPETEIYLVSHVLMSGNEYESIENDYKVCSELNKLYPQTIVAPFFANPIEAKSFISGLDFFTGARMHACIAAFSSGVPVYPLAYSRKFNGLFGETLQYKSYGDLVTTGAEDLLKGMQSAFENRKQLAESIKSTMQNVVFKKEDELVKLIADAIAAA